MTFVDTDGLRSLGLLQDKKEKKDKSERKEKRKAEKRKSLEA